jgi:arginase
MEINFSDISKLVDRPIFTPPSDGYKSTHGSTDRAEGAGTQLNTHQMELAPVSLVGACVNEGQNYYDGVENAPNAFRKAGILHVISKLGRTVYDAGNITGSASTKGKATFDTDAYYDETQVKNSRVLGDTIGRLHEVVRNEADKGHFVLTLGGDHSIAAGTISAIKQRRSDMCVVWVDAHADCNIPETSPSGNFHGMPVGLLLNWFRRKVQGFEWIADYLNDPLPENRIAYIGLRDVDEHEKMLLRRSNMHVYSMIDVERMGIARIMEDMIEKISPESNPRPIHLSLDIDGIDPHYAPGTGTRAKGGLNYREARYLCTRLAETGRLESMDLVEVNPDIDTGDTTVEHGDNQSVEANASATIKLGIDLIEFALGKTLV